MENNLENLKFLLSCASQDKISKTKLKKMEKAVEKVGQALLGRTITESEKKEIIESMGYFW